MQAIAQIGPSATISASTTSARQALDSLTPYCWVVNAGTVLVYVAFGNSAVEAAATDFPVPPGVGVLIRRKPAHTHVAALTASSTAVVAVACVSN
jgi:hypothetical protein